MNPPDSDGNRARGNRGTPTSGDRTFNTDHPALDGSSVIAGARGLGERVAAWIRRSWIYRWLTAEPEPDVIVIDLRETRTVGPVLRVLDRGVGVLGRAAAKSRVGALAETTRVALLNVPLRVGGLALSALGLVVAASALIGGVSMMTLASGLVIAITGLLTARDTRDWTTLRETRPVELVIKAFEPPNPPAREGTDDSDDDRTKRENRGNRTKRDNNDEP